MHNKSLITPEKYVTQLFLFHNVYHLGVNSVRLCVWYRAVGVLSVDHIFFLTENICLLWLIRGKIK